MDTFEGKSQKLRIDISSIEIENNNSSSFNRKLISCDKITKVEQRGNSVLISVSNGFYTSPTEIAFNDYYVAVRACRAIYNATPMSRPISIDGNTLYIGGRYSFHGKSIRMSDIQEASANREGELTIRCKRSFDSFSIRRKNSYEAQKEADMINNWLQKAQRRSSQSDLASWIAASGRSSFTSSTQTSQKSTQTRVQPKVKRKKTSIFRNVAAIVIVLILCSFLNAVIDNDKSASTPVSTKTAMIDYIGLTVGDIEDRFGTDYTADYWDGGYNMFYSDASGCPYVFILNPPDEFDGDRLDKSYAITGVSCSVLDAAVWGTAKIGMSHDDFAEAIGQPYTVSIPIDWEDSLPGNVLIIDADGKNELQGGPHKLFLLEDNEKVVFVSLWKIPTDS